MRDMTIEQTVEFGEEVQADETTLVNAEAGMDTAKLARLQADARRLQSDALVRFVGRLFGRKPRARREDAMEQAFYRCHKRDAELLRRIGESAARALGGRAVTGSMSDHLLDDIGLTRKDIEGRNVPGSRVYNADIGSTAA